MVEPATLVTMAGDSPTGCCVWSALNNIALFRHRRLVNNNIIYNLDSGPLSDQNFGPRQMDI